MWNKLSMAKKFFFIQILIAFIIGLSFVFFVQYSMDYLTQKQMKA